MYSDINTIVNVLILITACLVIIGGNILTLAAIWRTESLRTIPNMYVTSLALADLATGVVGFCHISLIRDISEQHYNKYLCLCVIVITMSLTNVSCFLMVLIALDRYLYIIYPLRYTTLINARKTKITISLAWIFSFISNMYIFAVNNWKDADGCMHLTVPPSMIRAIQLIVFFTIENILTSFFYGSIILVARRQQKAIVPSIGDQSLVITASSWKLIKLFIVMFGIFFVCWTPVALMFFANAFIEVPNVASNVILSLVYVNSGANCFVYGWFNKDFRSAYILILKSCCRCCSPAQVE